MHASHFLIFVQNLIMAQRNLELIINPSEITAGTRGASLGPVAILTAARSVKDPFFGQFSIVEIAHQNHDLDHVSNTPFAKNIAGFAVVFNRIKEQTNRTLTQDKFPFILAGDHGSAAGTIAGIKAAFPNKRLGVVWIDAHGDLHSPYTTPSGNMHGMPLNLTIGDDNISCQRNQLSQQEIEMWNALKGSDSPRISPSDLVFVAVRDTEPEEDYLIQHKNITNHTVEQVRKLGPKEIAESILKQLEACDLIYISFDVDSMDPEITSYGTGTPVANGITPEEANTILTTLARSPKTCCIEFVEINPCLDNKKNVMAETAFHLTKSVINTLNS